ncbi:pyridoxal-phosphate-dependent aminotransferase family protein [Halocynthiibacter sp.]|uniref:pyridoxal-phosphate-dependent aminotransferase family protein n=1 Tax=Halocynthiibacter sp. TaxID=1979210 RepID=UPI003C596FCC
MPHIRNFTPGPVEISEQVLAAQYGSQKLHVGPDFAETYVRVTENLQTIFGTNGHVAVVPGCGTLANEMALGAFLQPGKRALILDAGYFSSVLQRSVEGWGAQADLLPIPAGQPADPQIVQNALSAQDYDLLCFTHVETSTGLLNPIDALTQVAKAAGVPVMVDSVSALGTCPAQMDDLGISAMTTASQKGLESVPGLGMVALSETTWQQLETRQLRRGGMTDLLRWREQFNTAHDWHPSLTTMPVGVVYALDIALKKILSEGLETRFSRHIGARDYFCDAMTQAGFDLQIIQGARAAGVTAVQTGGRFASSRLVNHLISDHHIRIAGGFGANKEDVFRVAHMGDHANIPALKAVVSAITEFAESHAK